MARAIAFSFPGMARAEKTTTVAEAMVRRVSTVDINAPAGELLEIFERGEVALVIDDARRLLGLITKMDLIDIVAGRRPTPSKHAPSGT